ncbi:MAG: hypothetical protein U0X20_11380 [Caldilineaceae bacterium]
MAASSRKISGAHLIDNQMLANVGATYPDVTGMGGAVVWDSDISAIGNTFAKTWALRRV